MAAIVIREAVEPEDWNAVRRLMRDYGDYLANNPSGAANIRLVGYGEELERLPGITSCCWPWWMARQQDVSQCARSDLRKEPAR